MRALTRAASAGRLPAGVVAITGNALDPAGWAGQVAPADTFVHLIGTPHPSPAKAAQFQAVDLPSIRAAVQAATTARIRHFVYLSVAHPAPVMHAFIAVRQQGEALIAASGLDATILRPWYILGPGHRWPYLLLPFYAVARRRRPALLEARRCCGVLRGVLERAAQADQGPFQRLARDAFDDAGDERPQQHRNRAAQADRFAFDQHAVRRSARSASRR